jgi:hypothetical protein
MLATTLSCTSLATSHSQVLQVATTGKAGEEKLLINLCITKANGVQPQGNIPSITELAHSAKKMKF